MLLGDEDTAEFEALAAALRDELAPVPCRRFSRASPWRLGACAGPIAWRSSCSTGRSGFDAPGQPGGPGIVLTRDGRGPRAFGTLLRYRGAVQAEFRRSLRAPAALKAEEALPVGQAASAALALEARQGRLAALALEARARRPLARPPLARRPKPNEPQRRNERRLDYLLPDQSVPGPALHKPAACWTPNEPATRRDLGEFRGAEASNEP